MICKIVCLFFHCITKTSYHHHHFSSLNLLPTTCVLHKLVSPQFPVFFLSSDIPENRPFFFVCLIVSTHTRARAKWPVLPSCLCLHVALLSLPLSGTKTMWWRERESETVRASELRKKGEGQKKKEEETRERMQM